MRNVCDARMRAFMAGVVAIFLGGCATDNSKQQLNAGYRALDQHEYDQAIVAADTYLQKTPNGPGSAEACYLQGRVYEERSEEAGRLNNNALARSTLQAAGSAYTPGLTLSPPPKAPAAPPPRPPPPP